MKKIIFVITTLLTVGFILPQTIFGIGQMIEPIVIKDVLRNSEVTDTLVLFNSEDKEVVYQLKAEGEINGWASFYKIDDKNLENPITEISIPAKSRVKAIVKFTIPEDTPNGKYTGEVAIITAPAKDEEAGKMAINVLQRVGREVSITVTDEEVLKFETTIIPLRYGVGENEPLQVKVIHDNQGNVSIKPDIQLKIIKNGGNVFNAIFPYPEDEKPVRPLERKVMSSLVEWQTAGQDDGQYKAEVKILLDGEVTDKSDFGFTVGTVVNGSNNFGFLSFVSRIGGGNLMFGWILIGGFFVVLAILIGATGRKRIFGKFSFKDKKIL